MGYRIKYASYADKIFYKADRLGKLEKQDYKCFYCGCKLTRETVTTDHITPLSKNNRWHNTKDTVAACDECNSKKGDQELVDDYFDTLLRKSLEKLEERTKLAEWRLSFDHKGSFRKWKRFHEKRNDF